MGKVKSRVKTKRSHHLAAILSLAAWVFACAGAQKVEKPDAKELALATDEVLAGIREIETFSGRGQAHLAVIKYADLMENNPDNRLYRYLHAWSMAGKDAAWKVYNGLVQKDPTFYWGYVGLARIYDLWEIDDQAQANFEKALELNPEIPLIHLLKGNSYQRRRQFAKAHEEYAKAREGDPDNPNVFLQEGLTYLKEENREKAITSFHHALEADAQNFPAHFHLAQISEAQGKPEEAIRHYTAARDLAPNHFETRIRLGRLLETKDKPEEAVAELERARAVKAEDVDLHLHLAKLYRTLGKEEQAIDASRRALELKPDVVEARLQLADIYLKRKELGAAEQELKAALDIKSKAVDPHLGLARIYRDWKKYIQSIEEYQQVLKLKPDHAQAKEEIQSLYAGLNISPQPITGRDVNQIWAKIRKEFSRLYNVRLKEEPNLRGAITVQLKMNDRGGVTEVKMPRDTVRDPAISACIHWNFRRAKLVARKGSKPPKGRTYSIDLNLKPPRR